MKTQELKHVVIAIVLLSTLLCCTNKAYSQICESAFGDSLCMKVENNCLKTIFLDEGQGRKEYLSCSISNDTISKMMVRINDEMTNCMGKDMPFKLSNFSLTIDNNGKLSIMYPRMKKLKMMTHANKGSLKSISTSVFDDNANISSCDYYTLSENNDTLEYVFEKYTYDKRFPCNLVEYTYNENNKEINKVIYQYDDNGDEILNESYYNGQLLQKNTKTTEYNSTGKVIKSESIKASIYDPSLYNCNPNGNISTIETIYDDINNTITTKEYYNNEQIKETIKKHYQDKIVIEEYHKPYRNYYYTHDYPLETQYYFTGKIEKIEVQNINGDIMSSEEFNYDNDKESRIVTIYSDKNTQKRIVYDKDNNIVSISKIEHSDDFENTTTYLKAGNEYQIAHIESISNGAIYVPQYYKLTGTRIWTDYVLCGDKYKANAIYKYDSYDEICSYKYINNKWYPYQKTMWNERNFTYNEYYGIIGTDTIIQRQEPTNNSHTYIEKLYINGVETPDYKYSQVIDGLENGTGYVDLGLPSGNLWASMNYGAKKFYENGIDVNRSDINKDVAKELQGGRWTTPSIDDWLELICECQWMPLMNNWIDSGDDWVYGVLIIGPNNHCIMLPLQYPGEAQAMWYFVADMKEVCYYANYYKWGHIPTFSHSYVDSCGVRAVIRK